MPSTPPQGSDGPYLRLACQLFVLVVYPISRWRLLFRPYTNPGTDLDFYFDYVRRAASGQAPFADFAIEYPPAAWLVMRAPGTTDWVSYVHRFAWIAVTFEIAAFGLFLLVARRVAPQRLWILAAAYVAATTLLREFLATRLDSGLLFLLMLWSWLTFAPAAGTASGRRSLSYGVLGLATSFKVAPALMLPFVLAHDWRGVRGGERWRQPLWFAAGVVLPFVVLWPIAGSAPLGFLTYHIDRGLEIESVWATVLWPMRWVGQALAAAHVAHSIELIGPWSSAIARLSLVASVAAVGLCLAAEVARPWRGSALVAATIGLAVFVSLSKVLSPQYLLWLIPLLLVAGAEAWSTARAFRLWSAALILVAVLTTLIYPRFFLAVVEMRPLGFLLLFARNGLLVLLVALLARRVWNT